MRSTNRSHLIRITLSAMLVSLAVLFFFFSKSPASFPPLPPGSFIGKISGLEQSVDVTHLLYMERVAEPSGLFVVVLAEGWQPQMLSLRRVIDDSYDENTLTRDLPFQVITLTYNDRKVILSGSGDSGEFGGDVIGSKGQVGEWQLESFDMKALPSDSIKLADIKEWLTYKAEFVEAQTALRNFKEASASSEETLARLSSFVQDELQLKDRAEERKVSLRNDLKEKQEEKKELQTEVSKQVSELGLLSRIKKRGKAISLARKVANRENKWYFANWSTAEDLTGIEEYLQHSSNIDYKVFERKLVRSREKQKLVQEIASEKRKIRGLELALAPKVRTQDVRGGRRPARDIGTQKSLWEKMWGR